MKRSAAGEGPPLSAAGAMSRAATRRGGSRPGWRSRGGGPAGVVEAFAGLRVVEGAVALRLPDLGASAVAVIEVDGGAVAGAPAIDVHALAERLKGAVGDGPLLGARPVAGVDLHGGQVHGTRAPHVDA